MLRTPHVGTTDWVWFLAEILDWLGLRADYDDYVQDPSAPWPHSFISQDLVQAFAAMAMFFPEPETTTQVIQFVNSSQCTEFRNSLLFDPKERGRTRPDRRNRTSYRFRHPAFWTEWKKFLETKSYFADVYPIDWSMTVRPIIAHCQLSLGPPSFKRLLTGHSVPGWNRCACLLPKRPASRRRNGYGQHRTSPPGQAGPLHQLRRSLRKLPDRVPAQLHHPGPVAQAVASCRGICQESCKRSLRPAPALVGTALLPSDGWADEPTGYELPRQCWSVLGVEICA